MRLKKITSLKDWFIVGTLGFGLSLATMTTLSSLMGFSSIEFEGPREIVLNYLICMGGGFCWGGLMFIFCSLYLKIKNRIIGGRIIEE